MDKLVLLMYASLILTQKASSKVGVLWIFFSLLKEVFENDLSLVLLHLYIGNWNWENKRSKDIFLTNAYFSKRAPLKTPTWWPGLSCPSPTRGHLALAVGQLIARPHISSSWQKRTISNATNEIFYENIKFSDSSN